MGLGKGNQTATPRLHQLQVTQSVSGIARPLVWGTNRVQQSLYWYGDFTSVQSSQQGGKGLGKNGGTGYEYYAAVIGLLCDTPVSAIGNVWSQNGNLTLQSVTEEYVVPSGGGAYSVSKATQFAYDTGVGQYGAYSVTANNYGAPAPVVMTGYQATPQQKVATITGSGQYKMPSPGLYEFPASSAGQLMQISYVYSLYTLGATEDYNIPNTSPYEITVQYQTQFVSDNGVFYILTGQPLTSVSGSPGPGEYNPNGGNYLFNAADASAAIAIKYTWQQSNSNVDPASTLAFTLINGLPGQAPWSYLTTYHPSQAYGYSAQALVCTPKMDLGQAAQMPNYNYEVSGPYRLGAGIIDADAANVIVDLLFNPYYGAGFQGTVGATLGTIARDYWNSNNFFISPVLDSARACASIIDEWCEAGNTGNYWSEGQLKFVPYGDTTTVGNGYVFTPQTSPIVDLDDSDFIADANEDPVQVSRTPWQDAYNQVKVQFTNRLNAYNPDVVTESDDYAIAQFGLRPEGQKDYSFLCTAAAAAFSANTRLKRLVYIRRTFTFRISGLRYIFLEPMDLVTVTDIRLGLDKYPVRITKIEEDSNRIYTITAEEFPWGTSTATLYPKQPGEPPPPPPALADPGDTIVQAIFEPTSRVATTLANSAFQVWLALSGGSNWGGCNVWLSFDNQSYQALYSSSTGLSQQYGTSRAGFLTANLPAGTDPDTTHTLSVSTSGQLFDVSRAQADAFATLCKVGDEYISYQNALLTASSQNGLTNDYDLTYLRRGVFTSPDLDHVAGEQFIRCDEQIFQYSYDPSLAGKTIYFKFTSFNLLQNRQQNLADVPAYPYTILGTNLAANMTLDAVLDISGTSANVRVYQLGQPVGTSGTGTLPNGAVITLPGATITGQPLNTIVYVNYDPYTLAYVAYTDYNAWLLDETINGFIKIGQVTTPSNWVEIPILGGGSFAIGAGYGASGDSIPFLSGYSAASSLIWTSPRSGYSPSQQIKGVASSSGSGGTLSSFFQARSGSNFSATSNWIAGAWTSGAAVTVTTSGGYTYISFTTANGDDLCFVYGSATGGSVPIPSGFSASNFIGLAGMVGTASTGNGLQYVRACNLDAFLNLTILYDDNSGNRWGGTASVFGCFWKSGGGVESEAVTNGTSIIIPLVGGKQLALVRATAANGSSFGVPSGFEFGNMVASTSMSSYSTTSGSDVCHGWTVQNNGTSITATMQDGSGHTWYGIASIFAIVSIQ